MSPPEEESPNSIGRRGFLKSLFGLTAGVGEPAQAKSKRQEGPCLLWADMQTGFIGFPSGLNIRSGTPGSVMKLVTSAALLEERLIDPNHKFMCNGHATIHSETFHCQFAHGLVDLTRAIAVSCNAFFVNASHKISTDVFLKYARSFGFDKPMARIASGAFPEHSHDPSYTFVLGVNQSMQPTALQLLRLAALIATEGKLPHLHSADDMEPGLPFETPLSHSTWHRLQQGMQIATYDGTAKHLDPENKMHIAAKTGTTMHGQRFQSCIIGYFPYDRPKNAFCVWSPVGTSQEAAVPEAHKFLFSTTW